MFPAMTRRLAFDRADIHYLANLCHNCGACLYACQYAAPHEFNVNVPQTMARVRVNTYTEFAWPKSFGRLYARNGLTLSLALAACLAFFLILCTVANGTVWANPAAQNFYAIFSHNVMVTLFAPIFAFSLFALSVGLHQFWREIKRNDLETFLHDGENSKTASREALQNALTLKYLDGGHGEGCNEADDRSTLLRRRFHHWTFYGFLLCFAATSVATIYHYALGWAAPYEYFTLPKLLGVPGGFAMVIGTSGLFWLRWKRNPQHSDAAQKPMDLGFTALLFLVASTGLALMFSRATSAMPLLLSVHLGAVMAFFATMPYSKFAHGIYRGAALLKHAIERRQTVRAGSGEG